MASVWRDEEDRERAYSGPYQNQGRNPRRYGRRNDWQQDQRYDREGYSAYEGVDDRSYGYDQNRQFDQSYDNRPRGQFNNYRQDQDWRRSDWRFGQPNNESRAWSESRGFESGNFDRGDWREQGQGYGQQRNEYGRCDNFDNDDRGNSYSQRDMQRGSAGSSDWGYAAIWWEPGPETGRGPEGYKRSDERIKEDVNERLMQHGRINASGISVDVKEGEVTLSGSVQSRQTKRMVEDTVESISGVTEVNNQLRVNKQNDSANNTSGSQSHSSGQNGTNGTHGTSGMSSSEKRGSMAAASSTRK